MLSWIEADVSSPISASDVIEQSSWHDFHSDLFQISRKLINIKEIASEKERGIWYSKIIFWSIIVFVFPSKNSWHMVLLMNRLWVREFLFLMFKIHSVIRWVLNFYCFVQYQVWMVNHIDWLHCRSLVSWKVHNAWKVISCCTCLWLLTKEEATGSLNDLSVNAAFSWCLYFFVASGRDSRHVMRNHRIFSNVFIPLLAFVTCMRLH